MPKQLVGFAAGHPLLFAPGTQFSYSNTNYIVLAMLAERVGRQSYDKQLRDYIVRPLKLNHTSLPAGNATLPDVHGYLSLRAYDKNATSAPSIAPRFPVLRLERRGHPRHRRGRRRLLPRASLREAACRGAGRGDGGHVPDRWRVRARPISDRRAGLRVGPYTKTINTIRGRAWGHGGSFPGYYNLPISSPDGSRQAVLFVNTDPTLMQNQLKQVYDLLDTAYGRGVPS